MQPVPFDDAAFVAAQGAAKPILLTVSAEWCIVCAAQRPILARLSNSERFRHVVIFNIDWDTQKTLVRRFNARAQGTLIVFKGATETGRAQSATQEFLIVELLEGAL